MSIAMGLVPSSVVATVTWHVVGLHGGKQDACPLAGSSARARRISGQSLAKAPGGRRNTCAQRSLLDLVDGLRRWACGRGGGEEQKERR